MSAVAQTPCRGRRAAELYDAVRNDRRAWLVLLLADHVTRHGAMTVGDLMADFTATGRWSTYDVVRAVHAADRYGWLRLADDHEHRQHVGFPWLEELQATVPVDAPTRRGWTEVA